MASPLIPSTTLVLSCCCCFFLLSTMLPLASAATYRRGGFTVELLHRDSPGSPYYNHSATPLDLLRSATRRSVSRAQYLAAASTSTSTSSDDDDGNTTTFQSDLTPDNVEYLMALSLGTPPIKRLLILDTGSDIIWTQCEPCSDCNKQNAPFFNPSMSSTYAEITCDLQACQDQYNTSCASDTDYSCSYGVLYADQSYTEGVLASETVRFDSTTSTSSKVSISNLVFGCSHVSKGLSFDGDGQSQGLVGLGAGASSLISQLSSTIGGKFSYCLVPFFSRKVSSSVLSFGNKAVVSGMSTPLIVRKGYYVTLEAIIVGGRGLAEEEKIEIQSGSSHLDTTSSGGRILVDSGTTYIHLDIEVVEQLEKKLSSIIMLRPVNPPLEELRMCFEASRLSTCDLPYITFQFSGASVKLSPLNTFTLTLPDVVCLAIVPKLEHGEAIFGNMAQQNYHIGFDLEKKMVSFAPANCANT